MAYNGAPPVVGGAFASCHQSMDHVFSLKGCPTAFVQMNQSPTTMVTMKVITMFKLHIDINLQ